MTTTENGIKAPEVRAPNPDEMLTMGFVATSSSPAYVNVRHIVSMYPAPSSVVDGHTGTVDTVHGARAIFRPWNLFLAEVALALSHVRQMR